MGKWPEVALTLEGGTGGWMSPAREARGPVRCHHELHRLCQCHWNNKFSAVVTTWPRCPSLTGVCRWKWTELAEPGSYSRAVSGGPEPSPPLRPLGNSLQSCPGVTQSVCALVRPEAVMRAMQARSLWRCQVAWRRWAGAAPGPLHLARLPCVTTKVRT